MAILNQKYANTKKYDTPLYLNPSCVEELFCVEEIDNTGIFKLNNGRYSKVFVLSDINFNGLTTSEQKNIIESFSKVLDSISCRFSFTIANENDNDYDISSNFFLTEDNDKLNKFEEAYNELIVDRISVARKGLHKSIYLTLTVESDSFFNASTLLSTIESSLRTLFTHLGTNEMSGSNIVGLSTNERIQKLYNFSHFGLLNNGYQFDYHKELDSKHDWKNIVAPITFKSHNKFFEMNGCYGAVYYIDNWANELQCDIISNLSEVECTSYISINSELLDVSTLRSEINRKHSRIGLKIENEKQSNRNKNDFLSDASDILLDSQNKLNEFIRKISTNDNRYFNTTVLIMILCESKESFLNAESSIQTIIKNKGCDIFPCFTKQIPALNSVYMFGAQEFKRVCNLSSICQAMLVPFKSQEINDENGRFLGLNQITQVPIKGDRLSLSNKAGLYLGTSRFGKSVFCKIEVLYYHYAKIKNQQIIIDPQGEYKDMVNSLGGSIVSFSELKELYVNPLDIDYKDVDYSRLQELIGDKIDFIFTLFASCMKRELTPAEQSVLDKVIYRIYSNNYSARTNRFGDKETVKYDFNTPNYMKEKETHIPINLDISNEEQIRKYSPTLQDVFQALDDYKESTDAESVLIAKNLSLNMDVFINGSLNLFNHYTNVDLNNKLICFDLSDMKTNLKNTAMLIMIEIIRSRIRENWMNGIYTHLNIDEFHELLNLDKVCQYVIKIWKEEGKHNAILTGITQNMTDLINNSANSEKLKAIIGNTKYFVLFNQSKNDREMLMDYMPFVSPAMFNYVEGAMPGMGLYVFENNTVPFDFRIPSDSPLYTMVKTDGSVAVSE